MSTCTANLYTLNIYGTYNNYGSMNINGPIYLNYPSTFNNFGTMNLNNVGVMQMASYFSFLTTNFNNFGTIYVSTNSTG